MNFGIFARMIISQSCTIWRAFSPGEVFLFQQKQQPQDNSSVSSHDLSTSFHTGNTNYSKCVSSRPSLLLWLLCPWLLLAHLLLTLRLLLATPSRVIPLTARFLKFILWSRWVTFMKLFRVSCSIMKLRYEKSERALLPYYDKISRLRWRHGGGVMLKVLGSWWNTSAFFTVLFSFPKGQYTFMMKRFMNDEDDERTTVLTIFYELSLSLCRLYLIMNKSILLFILHFALSPDFTSWSTISMMERVHLQSFTSFSKSLCSLYLIMNSPILLIITTFFASSKSRTRR